MRNPKAMPFKRFHVSGVTGTAPCAVPVTPLTCNLSGRRHLWMCMSTAPLSGGTGVTLRAMPLAAPRHCASRAWALCLAP